MSIPDDRQVLFKNACHVRINTMISNGARGNLTTKAQKDYQKQKKKTPCSAKG